MAKATAEGDALRLATCGGALSQLWQIASRKLDVSTRFMMDHAHEILDADEGGNKAELKLEQPHEALKFGLWLNIAPKTYRLKNLRFEELGIDVDVPKSL